MVALISSPVMSAAIAVPTIATNPPAASVALTVVRMRFTPYCSNTTVSRTTVAQPSPPRTGVKSNVYDEWLAHDLRPRDARHGRQHSGAGGQMQKLSAGKFHSEPPSRFTSLDHLVGAGEHGRGYVEAERLAGHAFVARQAALKDLTLDHFAKDRLHVFFRKRSHRLRANVSKGATAQSKRSDGCIIGCLDNCDHVVRSQCPECVLHVRSTLFRHAFECLRPFRRILDVADSLIREARKHDVGCHGFSPAMCCIFPFRIHVRLSVAAPHSITSSARASRVSGRVRPSAFAVVRLMTRSNLVGCSTGRSPGLAPRRILST